MTTRRKIGLGMLAVLILAFAILAALVEPKPVIIFEGVLLYCLLAAYLIVTGEKH